MHSTDKIALSDLHYRSLALLDALGNEVKRVVHIWAQREELRDEMGAAAVQRVKDITLQEEKRLKREKERERRKKEKEKSQLNIRTGLQLQQQQQHEQKEQEEEEEEDIDSNDSETDNPNLIRSPLRIVLDVDRTL